MNLVLSGSTHGHRINLDAPLDLPDGTLVDIMVERRVLPKFFDEEWDLWIKKLCGARENRLDLDAIVRERPDW